MDYGGGDHLTADLVNTYGCMASGQSPCECGLGLMPRLHATVCGL